MKNIAHEKCCPRKNIAPGLWIYLSFVSLSPSALPIGCNFSFIETSPNCSFIKSSPTSKFWAHLTFPILSSPGYLFWVGRHQLFLHPLHCIWSSRWVLELQYCISNIIFLKLSFLLSLVFVRSVLVFVFFLYYCETCPLSHFLPLRDHEAEIDAMMGHKNAFKWIKNHDGLVALILYDDDDSDNNDDDDINNSTCMWVFGRLASCRPAPSFGLYLWNVFGFIFQTFLDGT